jgi:hypothetical protein
MAGLGTDDRRSAQPLAPREQLRFTYFLLWDWSVQKSPDESAVPQDDFRKKNKRFTPKTHFGARAGCGFNFGCPYHIILLR